ncbi:MAG TPA: hypothetical protein VLM18_04830 [Croceibacterium sp.]|nr:hypothetical protein [Croceibacterium sp.]
MRWLALALLPLIAACDPGVHIAWEKAFDRPVDVGCVERALQTVAEDVTRTSYVSDDDSRGFGNGITVTRFDYSDPTTIGYYSLDIAQLANGKTHYWHGWGKLGTNVPDDERAKVVPQLNAVNQVVSMHCGLSFFGTAPREGAG